MKKYIILVIFIFLFSCGRWKTTKMKSAQMCLLNPGDSLGSVMLKYDDNDILDISFKIAVHQGNIYVADNILKRMQILNKNCEPVLLIGEKKSGIGENSPARYSKFQFSIIEAIAVDSNRNIFVQNSFTSSQKHNNVPGRDAGFALSYIPVFDQKGTLLYTLGKTGSPDMPFNAIESLTIDKADRLFVITKSLDTWSVYRFLNKRRDFNINFSESDFKDHEGKEAYSGKIEKVVAHQSGDEILISVAYYHAADFKYRKIFTYSIQKEKILAASIIIPDPKNELFNISNDKIYLWDIDEKNIRYMICNLKGDVINNISIKFPEAVNSFDEILIDSSGNFYSYHGLKRGVEILEWR
ncbi:MAG: hypothetical protein V1874_02340 [Spirochaetota bacterium]